MVSRLAGIAGRAKLLNVELITDASRRMRLRYLQQRASSKYRGVEFSLTFEQWRDWWLATGHVDERGKLRGQWVMGRRGDRGAYELGNIECVRAESNASASNVTRRYPGEYET